MPDEKVIVYQADTGEPLAMHSIDAKEAVAIGDYVMAPPGGKELSDDEKGKVLAAHAGVSPQKHPEQMLPEERAAARKQAAEAAQAAAGTTVTVAPAPPGPAATSSEPARSGGSPPHRRSGE